MAEEMVHLKTNVEKRESTSAEVLPRGSLQRLTTEDSKLTTEKDADVGKEEDENLCAKILKYLNEDKLLNKMMIDKPPTPTPPPADSPSEATNNFIHDVRSFINALDKYDFIVCVVP